MDEFKLEFKEIVLFQEIYIFFPGELHEKVTTLYYLCIKYKAGAFFNFGDNLHRQRMQRICARCLIAILSDLFENRIKLIKTQGASTIAVSHDLPVAITSPSFQARPISQAHVN